MKTKRLLPGFTLIELLVAMAITVILLGVLVYITGISMDTFKNSRNEVRASRQAKEAVDTLAKDFESMVAKLDGNDYEWVYAKISDSGELQGPNGNDIPNASQLIFFTGATDRYNGNIGGAGDEGGDVSAVGYRLKFKDQISASSNDKFAVFSLYRHLVNPKEAFDTLLAQQDLTTPSVFTETEDVTSDNFLVENVYEFTLTFLVEYTDNTGTTPITKIERVTLSPSSYSEFRLRGNGIMVTPSNSNIENGSLIGVEISISVITDHGLTVMKHVGPDVWRKQQAKYTYHYTKTINTPRP